MAYTVVANDETGLSHLLGQLTEWEPVVRCQPCAMFRTIVGAVEVATCKHSGIGCVCSVHDIVIAILNALLYMRHHVPCRDLGIAG